MNTRSGAVRSPPTGDDEDVTTTSLANPRRTRLAGAKDRSCQVAGPDCRGTATGVLHTPDGDRAACTACAQH